MLSQAHSHAPSDLLLIISFSQSTPGPLPLMSIHLSSMHHQNVQDGHHTLLTSEMLCYRSSITLTQSSALRYQVSRSLTLRLAADLDRNHATRCQPCSS
ncbi:hypothetical protein P692DRAFT_201182043 [Suillus brevipes Sb2]|nr:hypothetical protein P692DRAFT_201182043 [Suillus brevipes Sb2]